MALRAADWLKRQRQRTGYPKQETLAVALGVSRSTVANWEAGRGGPKPNLIPAIASLFGVSQSEVADIFGISLSSDLPSPAPPWVTDLVSRLDRLETQNREMAGLLRVVVGAAALAQQDEDQALEPDPDAGESPGGLPGEQKP